MNLRSLLEDLVNKPECYTFFIETDDKEPPMDIIRYYTRKISLPTASRTPNCLFKFSGTYKSHFTRLYWYGNIAYYYEGRDEFIQTEYIFDIPEFFIKKKILKIYDDDKVYYTRNINYRNIGLKLLEATAPHLGNPRFMDFEEV
jgi:hypothetical protein